MRFNYFDATKYEIVNEQKLYLPPNVDSLDNWTMAYGVKTGEAIYDNGNKTDIIKWMTKQEYEVAVNG